MYAYKRIVEVREFLSSYSSETVSLRVLSFPLAWELVNRRVDSDKLWIGFRSGKWEEFRAVNRTGKYVWVKLCFNYQF